MRKLFVRSAAAIALAAAFPLAGCKSSPGPSVEVRIPLADATPTLKRATVVVDYAKSGARPQIAGGSPSCTSILPHVSCRFSDADGKLTIEAESPQGFSGPVDLAVCRMVPDSPGTDAAQIAGRLRIEIAEARGSDGQPVADTKLAAKRDSSGATGPGATVAETAPSGDGGRRQRDGGVDPAASAASGAAAAGATGQGLVVTQDDLAAREQRRAEEQMKAREAQKKRDGLSGQAATGVAPGGSTGAVTAGEDDVPLGEEPGTGVNDATDDDARATEYGVRFDLAATSSPLGALQFDVKYNGGSGGWLGAGGGAACTWLVSAAIHACNDKRGGDLTCAIVDTNGIAGPAALMECTFKSRNSVAASDFSANVTDASTPGLEPADARVFVSGVYAR
jgi:hypothetical protein